jgi:ABC-type dipeptide/oligopeptide/nickel transport system permease subunit
LAIGLAASMGPGIITISLAIGFVYIPRFARVVRRDTAIMATSTFCSSAARTAVGLSGRNNWSTRKAPRRR